MTIRPLLLVMFIAALTAFGTGFFFPIDVILEEHVQVYSRFISELVPCISVMVQHALNPARAQFTLAVQWTFFPIYLITWFWTGPVWSKEMKQAILKETAKSTSIVKRRVGAILSIVVLGSLILTDFGVINAMSFFRGTIFVGDPLTFPNMLRAPFTSNFGMVLYAWFIPLSVAMYYWMFLLLTVNIREYFNSPTSSSE